ncbi:MAG TPA: hypothetical protein VEC10_08740, partial [Steroidobacteraceae bacterium]|nr:hypothetical protein [Steroidobacteraceae bacterium]
MSAANARATLAAPIATLIIMAAAVLRPVSPAFADEPRRPLDLATFPRTSLEITHRGADHTSHKYGL